MIPLPKFFTIITVFFDTINTLIGVIGSTATRCNKFVRTVVTGALLTYSIIKSTNAQYTFTKIPSTMKALVHILAQIFENYGETDAAKWKPKGGQVFTFRCDDDLLIYEEGIVRAAIEKMLLAKSDPLTKYKLISFETISFEPINVEVEMENQINEQIALNINNN